MLIDGKTLKTVKDPNDPNEETLSSEHKSDDDDKKKKSCVSDEALFKMCEGRTAHK